MISKRPDFMCWEKVGNDDIRLEISEIPLKTSPPQEN